MTRPLSIWCSVTSALSPPRPDLHTGDGDISMGAYSYIHTLQLSLASSYYFLRLYGDGNIENWHKECILCYCHRMHRMQYAIFDQNWEQNYLLKFNRISMNFLIAPCPHVTSEEYFQYSRVCITSDSDSVYVWCLMCWCVFMLQLFLLYLDNIYNIYV